MHSHVGGSHRAKFDDDSNSFRGIACEGQTHTHTDTHTDWDWLSSLIFALQTKRSGLMVALVAEGVILY